MNSGDANSRLAELSDGSDIGDEGDVRDGWPEEADLLFWPSPPHYLHHSHPLPEAPNQCFTPSSSTTWNLKSGI